MMLSLRTLAVVALLSGAAAVSLSHPHRHQPSAEVQRLHSVALHHRRNPQSAELTHPLHTVALHREAQQPAVEHRHHHFEEREEGLAQRVTKDWYPEFQKIQAREVVVEALDVLQRPETKAKLTEALDEVDNRDDIQKEEVREIAKSAACKSISEELLKPILAKYNLNHERSVDKALQKVAEAASEQPELHLVEKVKLLGKIMGGEDLQNERRESAFEKLKEAEE